MFNRNKISYGAHAVVTGAGSGIGRAFAQEIIRRGGQVVCADMNETTAQETVDQIKAANPDAKAWAVACDVTDVAAVEALAETTEQFLGQNADLVINNAGIGTGGSIIGDMSLDDWQATLDVNLWGVIYGCHVFAPRLRELGRGGIINVGSTASFAAAPLMGPYNVSKAAVLALSETLSAEMAGTDIAVTTFCPTFVKTGIIENGRLSGGKAGFASGLVEKTGRSAESVVKVALNGLDRREPVVMPQIEARAIWHSKRLFPRAYNQSTRMISRLVERAG